MTDLVQTSTRELLKELAEIEDRTFAVRASMRGCGGGRLDPELVRLAQREAQILARLRPRTTPVA